MQEASGKRFAHYECDVCHEPIGETGTVSVEAGIVGEALCQQHQHRPVFDVMADPWYDKTWLSC